MFKTTTGINPILWYLELRYLSRLRISRSFRGLRKFIAGQEAFFSVDENLVMFRLPNSIEEIGIIDTTCAVDWYLSHLADKVTIFSRLQGLRSIILRMRYIVRTIVTGGTTGFAESPTGRIMNTTATTARIWTL
jgi:hypothetical protein